MRNAIALGLTIACTSVYAGWVDKQGERLPETAYRKSNGDLVAQMVFVQDVAVGMLTLGVARRF